jgi:hypothetical protein
MKNTSGQTVYIDGTYTFGGNWQNACLYVLNTAGAVRWSYCGNGLQNKGNFNFGGEVALYPNEFVDAYGWYSCPGAGQTWDWAMYINAKVAY